MVLRIVLIGVAATLAIDLWALLLKRAFGIRSLDYCLLGRWVSHMRRGTIAHESIAAAPSQRSECRIGWASHYSIGIAFAAGFAMLAGAEWLNHPTFLPALVFGVATVAVPFFTIQPAFGLGVASSKTKNPAAARLKSLSTHAVFGMGLYFGAVVLA